MLRDLRSVFPMAYQVLRLMAISSLLAGRPSDALDHLRAATMLAPHVAELYLLVGRAHKALNDLPHAILAYRRCLKISPNLAAAHVSLGIALKACGDLDAAITSYRAALAIDPQLGPAHSALGNALALRIVRAGGADRSSDDESLQALRKAVELEPGSAAARHNLGLALAQAGQMDIAVEHFNVALALDSGREDTCVLMHALLSKLNRLEAARACCERWLQLNPPTPGVASRLATTLLALNDFDAAMPWAQRAGDMAPDMPEVLHNLAIACQQSLDVPSALVHLRRSVALAPGYRAAIDMLLMSMNYVEEDPCVVLQTHRLHAPALMPGPPAEHRLAGSRLRIGYVSGDLRRHSVAYFMEPIFTNHDRDRFEIFAYHTGHASDEVTSRLKAFTTGWVEAADLSDDALAERMRGDRIDVLVDLSGYTADGRLAMFARRPAPVQISYLGYPTTTGLSAIDFRVTDEVIDPQDGGEWSSETLLRFARGMFCYRPDAAPDAGPLPALRNGHITFGSFNNLAKVSEATLSLWAAVLHAVPGSKLCLKARSLGARIVRTRLLEQFAALGIGEDRLLLNPWRSDLHSHLDAYRDIDIGLDTYPFNGATTTCESLWMGVPVVSRCGATHVARMGASILRSAGLAGWSAANAAEFIELACRQASQPELLSSLRAGLREQLRASALMDATAHTADFERLVCLACDATATRPAISDVSA